jgi:hypothetical protein
MYECKPHQVMKKIPKSRRGNGNGETLSPFSGRPYKATGASLLPGFRHEPRPLLSFIVRVLNRKHRQMVRHHLESFLPFDFQFRTPEVEVLLRRLSDDPELLDCAADGMIAAMREMADMWIDSGKSRNDRDVDSPADRNVEDVLPGRVYSLFRMIDRSLLRNYPRYTQMKRDGSLQIIDTFPKFDQGALNGVWRLPETLRAHGVMWAAFFFSRFLNSPHSRHISRCDHCKRYFAYQRARLRTVTHGVSCPACEGKGSVKRTVISRAKRLDTAAKAWIELEARHKGRVQPEWVADQVNKAHGTPFGRRWVNQNLKEIQERVEALHNA